MTYKKYFCFACFLVTLAFLLFSTQKVQAQEIIRCLTTEKHEKRLNEHPELLSEQEFEQWLEEKMQENSHKRSRGTIFKIPVVVHVLHNGEPIGTMPNISDAQVISQIDVLNEDFRRMVGTNGYNTHPDGADAEIEFVLAKIDPQGNPSNGINRVDRNLVKYTDDQLDGAIRKNTIWNTDTYLNLWVCDISPDNILGYAQFPVSSLQGTNFGSKDSLTDGVIIDVKAFGSVEKNDGSFGEFFADFALGRSATHEIGHFLGLLHIWGSGGCSSDDYCSDTPPAVTDSAGCPTEQESCDTPDMFENYLDYSDDICMNIFTNCQVSRMRTVLTESPRRASLVNSIATSTVSGNSFSGKVVDANTNEGIPNAHVQFSGSLTPLAITDNNGNFTIPNFYFGNYKILTGAWGYQYNLMENMLIDNSTGVITISLDKGYVDNFELDLGWTLSGNASSGIWTREIPGSSTYNSGSSFEHYDPAFDFNGDFGNKCYLTGNSGGEAGNDDVDNGNTVLTSPIFDATEFNNPMVSFYRWFANGGGTGATPDDELTVTITNGIESVLIESINAQSPFQEEWSQEKYNIKDFLTPTDNMQVIFDISDNVTSTHGHLVGGALDLIEIKESTGESTVSTRDISSLTAFEVFPNPTSAIVNLNFNLTERTRLRLNIFNALGQLVTQKDLGNIIGASTERVSLLHLPKGIYFIQLNEGHRFNTKKIVLY